MIVLQYIAQTYLFKRAHYVGISTIFKNETSSQLKFTEMCLRRVLNRDQISHNESPAQLESCLMPKNDLTRRWSLFSSHHKDRELGLSAVRLNADGWLLSAMVQTLHPWFAGRTTAGSINPKLLRLICLQAFFSGNVTMQLDFKSEFSHIHLEKRQSKLLPFGFSIKGSMCNF